MEWLPALSPLHSHETHFNLQFFLFYTYTTTTFHTSTHSKNVATCFTFLPFATIRGFFYLWFLTLVPILSCTFKFHSLIITICFCRWTTIWLNCLHPGNKNLTHSLFLFYLLFLSQCQCVCWQCKRYPEKPLYGGGIFKHNIAQINTNISSSLVIIYNLTQNTIYSFSGKLLSIAPLFRLINKK